MEKKTCGQVVLMLKNPTANAGDLRDAGSIPESGRSPGGANGNPLQYPCLENPLDTGIWRATVHRVAQSWTQSDLARRQARLSLHGVQFSELCKCIWLCSHCHHEDAQQWGHPTETFRVSLCGQPLSLPTAIIDLSPVPIGFALPACHINEITRYVIFWAWLLSLSITYVGFIHFIAYTSSLFLFLLYGRTSSV